MRSERSFSFLVEALKTIILLYAKQLYKDITEKYPENEYAKRSLERLNVLEGKEELESGEMLTEKWK
jgi:hypothetical protein